MTNPAITAALLAASRRQEVEDVIEGRLKKAKAFGPSSAILPELTEKQAELLEQAIGGGTVRRLEDGRVYLHEQAVADRKDGQGFVLLLVVLILASFGASAIVLASRVAG